MVLVRRTALHACSALAAVCVAFALDITVVGPATASSVCTAGSSSNEASTLSSVLTSASNSISGTHGIEVYDLTTGVTCAIDAGDQMITASIVKVSILAALLVQHQEAGTGLTDDEQDEATTMIENSDNDAASDLYADIGSASGLQAFFAKAGMTDSEADAAWGLTETTAADQVKLLKLLLGDGSLLTRASRDYELGLMRDVESDQRWGTPYDAAGGVTVAVKNGWLSLDSGEWHINSLGVFTGGSHTYVMAVTTEENDSEDSGISRVETLAKAVNTQILSTSTKPAPVVTAAETASPSASASASTSVGAGVNASASPSPSASASPSQSPSPSASAIASPSTSPSPTVTTAAAASSASHTGVTRTLTVLAGVTAPGSALLLATRRRRLADDQIGGTSTNSDSRSLASRTSGRRILNLLSATKRATMAVARVARRLVRAVSGERS